MGKGDQRTRRGKIYRGTFGKRRPKKHHSASKPEAETTSETAPEPALAHAPRIRKAEKEPAAQPE